MRGHNVIIKRLSEAPVTFTLPIAPSTSLRITSGANHNLLYVSFLSPLSIDLNSSENLSRAEKTGEKVVTRVFVFRFYDAVTRYVRDSKNFCRCRGNGSYLPFFVASSVMCSPDSGPRSQNSTRAECLSSAKAFTYVPSHTNLSSLYPLSFRTCL